MAEFRLGVPFETAEGTVEVTVSRANPLPIGRRRFQLVVVDDAGNVSDPAMVEMYVIDTEKPTAVLKVPARVPFGQSFTLDGRGSTDAPPGRIIRYIWTLLD